ncbi:MAG: hypothetical protein HOM19_05005 [Candidatus Marinimicrobia bacterium]|nr:hypothetical protein [Candidatus Neomarinimicrobiota bacterium]
MVITLAGITMAIGGGSQLKDVGQWDVEENSNWNNLDGSTDYDFSGDVLVMVRDNVRCDSFTLTMENSTGENWYENDVCTEEGDKPVGHGDDPDGWYHMGTISLWNYNKGEYTINSSADVHLVPKWGLLGDEFVEGATGFFATIGGGLFTCCGTLFILLGGIFALTLKSPEKTTKISQGPSSFTTTAPLVSGNELINNTDESKDPEWWSGKDEVN